MPEALADDKERWMNAGAANGFNLMPDVFPNGLGILVNEGVLTLRRQDIFRHEYTGRTLQDQFELALGRPTGSGICTRRGD